MDSAQIDQELSDLDTTLDRLRVTYEQYFLGFERIEPQKLRKDVERRMGVLRREQLRNTALKFRFQTLVQRLSSLQQHWGRITRQIENGTFKRDVARAAVRFGDDAVKAAGAKLPKKEDPRAAKPAPAAEGTLSAPSAPRMPGGIGVVSMPPPGAALPTPRMGSPLLSARPSNASEDTLRKLQALAENARLRSMTPQPGTHSAAPKKPEK